MDNTQIPEEHNMSDIPQTSSPDSTGKAGPIIGIVIIIFVLLLGVLYFWGQRVNTTMTPEETQTYTEIQETSPEVIEEDFSQVEQELDEEFATMEAELEAEF